MRIHAVLIAIAIAACGGQQINRNYDPESQVREAIDAANAAVRHGQTDIVLAMLEPGFVLVADGATFHRDAAVLARLPVDRRVERMDHVNGMQAIVISRAGTQKYTEIWVRRDGRWRLSRLEAV